ncbi:MAG: putative ABC transporter permease [Oscillospiraceae bacterium]
MGTLIEYLTVWAVGAACYGSIELMFRGFTHWSMFVTGGICLMLLYIVETRGKEPLWQKWIMGAVIITTVEFVVGIIVNIILGWHVWDYSGMTPNLFGQICLPFTLVWFLLSILAMKICQKLHLWFLRFSPRKAT